MGLLLAALCASALGSETGRPFINVFPSSQTGGHFQNWGFIQDDRGVMYIGNGWGVQEFDGSTWRMIPISNGSFAKSFARDSNGCIYVGSAAELGYLQPDAPGTMRYVSLLPYIPEPDRAFTYIWAAHAAADGIYFQARERLFRFRRTSTATNEKKAWQVTVWRPDESDNPFIMSFLIDGTLYVLKRNIGLMKLEGDSLAELPGTKAIAGDRVYLMLPVPDRSGQFIIGTDRRGLFRYDGQSLTPYRTDVDKQLQRNILSGGIWLPGRSLALATMADGLYIVDEGGKALQHLTRATGLLSNTISAVSLDRQKNIWLAMDGGVAVLENTATLSHYPFVSGSAPLYFHRHQGRLYAAANDGLYYLDTLETQFRPVPGLMQNQCNDFCEFDGHLYLPILTGIYLVDTTQTVLVLPFQVSVTVISCLQPLSFDRTRILAGTTSGMAILRYNAADPWHMSLERTLPEFYEYIRQIIEVRPNEFWLSTYDAGAIRLRFRDHDINQPVVERFGAEQGLPLGTTSIFQAGGKLIFSSADGFYRFDEARQRFERDPFFKALAIGINASECAVAADADGNIWVNGGRETSLYRKGADGGYRIERGPFSRFNDAMVNTIYPEAGGVVWFGTTDGAVRYEPRQNGDVAAPFPALVRRVKFANDSTLYDGGGLLSDVDGNRQIPYRLNAVTFEFAAPSFIKPSANEFQIRLEGFENKWSAWSPDNKRNYTNLSPGHYVFHIKARNIYGQESTEGAFPFYILTPWYRSWLAMIGYALLAAGLVFGTVRLRTRALQERSTALEKTVQQRTAEIQAQKDNVEQLSRIGRDITANLSITEIIHTVYENVNQLMDAAVFAIGVYNPETNRLDFPTAIDRDRTLKSFSFELSDENRLAVWCFNHRQDVIINDYGRDYQNYIREIRLSMTGENPESILYLPLHRRDQVIGVITAQSYRKDAYTGYHLNMLRNLAAYSAIAMVNAEAYHQLDETLSDLKSTQEKLVTQSKLAALGALTAGIAHEIKNPLNFVNNFSELSEGLIKELETELNAATPDREAILEMLQTLSQNSAKIKEHGKRADSIVRSMLQHSRGKAGERQPTDLNAMLDEDIKLAYHGLRAQDNSFNIKFDTEFDPTIGQVEVVPQDISRVFLNILSNGCYEAHRKKMEEGGDFTPTLWVRTKNIGHEVEIHIRDNGRGIPAAVREKIFTPFFTTKPAGFGTGLGLSISYDIIVQGHKGQLAFETEEGQFTEFIICIPR